MRHTVSNAAAAAPAPSNFPSSSSRRRIDRERPDRNPTVDGLATRPDTIAVTLAVHGDLVEREHRLDEAPLSARRISATARSKGFPTLPERIAASTMVSMSARRENSS